MQNDNRREIRFRPEGALLRTYLRAAGVAPESIAKPLVGVVTVSSQVFGECPGPKELGDAVVKGVEAAGGMVMRWDTARAPEQMTWGHADSYSFAWRDQLADFIESWFHQHTLDGLVLVGDSHKTLAGMAMVMARLNCPSLIVTAGAAKWVLGHDDKNAADKKETTAADSFATGFLADKKTAAAALDEAIRASLEAQSAHAQHATDLMLEALGLTLPGMSTALPGSERQRALAHDSGERVVALIKTGHTARRMLTQNGFNNAVRFNAALGGSVDGAIHLMAIAHEAGVVLGLEHFDKVSTETPHVCRLGGIGLKAPHTLEDLDRAGGVWAVMHALKEKVSPITTVSGKGASELARTSVIKDSRVIMSSKPYAKHSGVGVVRGNLAPRGAIYLLNQAWAGLTVFRGPAMVFESERDAVAAIVEGPFKKGHAIVVRGQGPKGGPGLRKLRILPAVMEHKGLNKTTPLITDGRLPDVPTGLFISAASPEGAVAGPLAILKTGDVIDIDMTKRSMSVRLTEMDMRLRQTRWQPADNKTRKGFIDRYSRSVSDALEGAVLK
jgi:dihydroxy-acid dehydratase